MSDSHGIHVIDPGFVRPRLDAAYLLVEKGRGAFIDCGVNHSVPHLLAALDGAGLAPKDVDWLILTHVHLDHAGGAGELLRHLPGARLVVHMAHELASRGTGTAVVGLCGGGGQGEALVLTR